MKNFIRGKSLKILVPTLAVVTVFCLLSYVNVNPLALLANAASRAVNEFMDLSGSATADEASKIESLRAENAELRAQLVDYLDIKRENERLQRYFEIESGSPSYSVLPAKVIRRDASGGDYSFTLGVGSGDGVSVNDPVITENGLVGRVSGVTADSCTVDTILSPSIKVSAVDKNTLDGGIIVGSAQAVNENLTYLTQISEDNGIKAGDLVVTSGEGGVYPENLIVGCVKSVEFDFDTGERSAVVEPYENIADISSAAVLRNH